MSHIKTIVKSIQDGTSTARMQVEAAIAKAKDAQDYHALLSLTEERALEQADALDDRIKNGGQVGRLAGVPFVVKDNFLTYGAPTTAASKMLEYFDAPIQATAVEKLQQEGAICIGKANLDAFAHGGSTENSAFGSTKNAVDPSKVAGGSSGGSAVSVALGIVPFALGTDTGGSIRQPASFNGVVGVKPTYGAVSRYGVIAMASSTDTIGCLTHDVDDAEVIMEIISGRDNKDMTSLPDFFERAVSVKPVQKIGLIKESMGEATTLDVRMRIDEYADKLRAAGHIVEEVSMPILEHAVAMYYVIVPAEISSNLARYDGIRYGHRAENAATLAELYGKTRDEGFVTENKRRIIIGSYVLSSGYFDAYYQQAQKARTLLINAYNVLFDSYDVLLTPVSPVPAFGIGEKAGDPVQMYAADMMTVGPSLAGLPALSIPAGKDGNGLPVGAQLIGSQKSDSALLALAKTIEEQ